MHSLRNWRETVHWEKGPCDEEAEDPSSVKDNLILSLTWKNPRCLWNIRTEMNYRGEMDTVAHYIKDAGVSVLVERILLFTFTCSRAGSCIRWTVRDSGQTQGRDARLPESAQPTSSANFTPGRPFFLLELIQCFIKENLLMGTAPPSAR